ncbi:Wall-associated receptor kinase 2 [Ananas comosus]|uniref:Wall-associated receptor kinase 2 n=1 Tax=Ananas comosus TaxID=4615 RepID=A0A199VJ97_ANACO|nr:Wall-associated receptor kinase 2 [Ananas comosus]
MKMETKQHQKPILPLLMLTSLAAAAAAVTADSPRCRAACGNIPIPYPFGVETGCYREGFGLLCNDSYHPPKLSILYYDYEVIDISIVSGEMRVYLEAGRACYNSTGGLISSSTPPTVLIESPYVFSTRTKYVAVGCPNLGYFVDPAGYYVSGCVSICRPSKYDNLNGSCTGDGCCQSSIPTGLDYYEQYLQNFIVAGGAGIFLANSTPCAYGFLVDADWFRFTPSYLSMTSDLRVPIVLDWAIRNVGNGSAAVHNSTDYACRSANSTFYDSSNGAGYRCNCSKGYEGNPYIETGCQDINECEHKDQYPCYGICTNVPGSYLCECPRGTAGDAFTQDGCRPKDKFTLALKIVTGASLGIFFALFMGFWAYLGLQKKKLIRTRQKFFEQNGGLILQQQMRSCRELEKATNNFDTDRVLGRGGHGIVYKGILEDETVVAIKKSKIMDDNQTKEFATEMLILSQINHKNVVKLLGCCLEVEVPMLVYEFVSNGTLYSFIHGKDQSFIPFDERLRIAVESAGALAYMHSSASTPILHGDVKSANILLDDKFTAKVSDFGASKLAATDEVQLATLVQGTCGYLDPEYLITCQLTEKSDVYSFGVFILEIFTRKKALYFNGPEEDRSLASCFITAMKEGRCLEIFDSQVKSEARAELLEEIAEIAMQCLSMWGDERPAMTEVAERLERLRRIQKHPWVQADDSEEMDSLLGESLDTHANHINGHNYIEQTVFDLEEGKG